MNEIYFMATTFLSWPRLLFRGNEFYFVAFVATTFISWEQILFRGNDFYFMATNFKKLSQAYVLRGPP